MTPCWQAVAALTKIFLAEIETIDFSTPGKIRLIAASGQAVTVPTQHAFVIGEGNRL